MNHDDLISSLATTTDDEVAGMVSTRTRSELAEHIMSTPVEPAPARRRRRGLVIGVPLAVAAVGTAAVVVAATTGPPASPGRPPLRAEPAVLTFSTQGKYLVVKVKDPLADPARYRREFAAHGMNIRLTLVPASPSVAGTVVEADGGDGIQMISGKGKCFSGGGSCPVGVRIPIGFHGSASITFGRAARPGEQYTSTNSAFAPGEALHCVDIRGRTVDDALATLRRHKVTAPIFHYEEGGNGGQAHNVGRDKIPGTWYVTTADPWAPGQVMLWVQRTRPESHGDAAAYYRRLMSGCPR
ncbi:hypothetical protein OG417_47625 [Actinoallomurus sp. NBC_01490]|uniref:hypothetical protein n=1 Tax=Actinoallomurus sp. NBC_01490 TaxID=2903557 RepID=UPI002E32F26E|nr:hypothetical protein [Actinoallomurus sp. NBC_01490]